jgi:hypothetical protein
VWLLCAGSATPPASFRGRLVQWICDGPGRHRRARRRYPGQRDRRFPAGGAGGSPASLLHDVIGAPIIFFGTGLPEDNWHDSDESVSVDMLQAGAATLALLWPRGSPRRHEPAIGPRRRLTT